MTYVNITEAKQKLPELVGLIATEQEDDIVIMLNGKPAAKIIRCTPYPTKRTGRGKGKFIIPDDWDAKDEEIASSFLGAK